MGVYPENGARAGMNSNRFERTQEGLSATAEKTA